MDIDVIADAPTYVKDGLLFLAQGGSFAYGTNNSDSDIDLYGVTLPEPKILYPWDGKLVGFDEVTPFLHWKPSGDGLDRTIYSLPRFCKLASSCNPNILEMLFYPEDCIIYTSPAWDYLVENRTKFLSKEIYPRFTGMAHSSINRLKSNKSTSSKRIALHEKFGFDTKDAAQTARILLFCKDLLVNQTINIRMYSDNLKTIKEGHYDYDYLRIYFEELFLACKVALENSDLPHITSTNEIRTLMFKAMEKSRWGRTIC